MYNDNKGAIDTIYSGGKFDRNRHYKNRINRIRRAVKDKLLNVNYLETKQMLADGFTKATTYLIEHLIYLGLKEIKN